MAIDVGADAIDREYAVGNTTRNSCFIEGSNPASSSGQVKKVYIYVKANIGTVYVGIFTHEAVMCLAPETIRMWEHSMMG